MYYFLSTLNFCTILCWSITQHHNKNIFKLYTLLLVLLHEGPLIISDSLTFKPCNES